MTPSERPARSSATLLRHPSLERGLGGDRAHLRVVRLRGEDLLQLLDGLAVLLLLDPGEADLLVDAGREVGPQREQGGVLCAGVGEPTLPVRPLGALEGLARLGTRVGRRRLLELHLERRQPARLAGQAHAHPAAHVARELEVDVPGSGGNPADRPAPLLVRLHGRSPAALGELELDGHADERCARLVGDLALHAAHSLPVLGVGGHGGGEGSGGKDQAQTARDQVHGRPLLPVNRPISPARAVSESERSRRTCWVEARCRTGGAGAGFASSPPS